MPKTRKSKRPVWRREYLARRRSLLLHQVAGVTLHGSAPFRHTRGMLVPARAGIYLVHDLRGTLYVGRSNHLRRRFHEHYWLTDNELLRLAMRAPFGELTFSWILCGDAFERAALETRLIGWLQPICNRLIPLYENSGD